MGCYISHKPKETYPVIEVFNHSVNSHKAFCKNNVHTTKYTFYSFPFKFMLEQLMRFSNIFFIVNTILTCIPQVSAVTPITYSVPLAIIMFSAMFRELREDIRRYIDDIKADLVKYTLVNREIQKEVKSSQLLPGDCILLKQGQRCPADLIPLHTDSLDPILIQTAEIDGEVTPKEVFVPRRLLQISQEHLFESSVTITCDAPNPRFDSFRAVVKVNEDKIGCDASALMFQGSVLRSNDLLCSVVYTGDFTKLALNREKRRMRLSGTDKQMNSFVAVVFLVVLGISVFCSVMATIMFYTHQDHWYLDLPERSTHLSVKEFFSYFTLSSYLIPIACAVCLEIAKTLQSLFMKWDSEFKYQTNEGEKGIVVRCTAMNDELGFIEYILTDKTGTLTENEMNFVECIIDGQTFKENQLGVACGLIDNGIGTPKNEQIDSNKILDFIYCMALCHNATVVNEKYKSPSPDEEALLRAAEINGVKFTQRLQSSLKIKHPNEEVVNILAVFPFSSERARSSVLVKIGERIVLFTKGADHVINGLCASGEFCDVKPLAEQGLRTLVLCKREITKEFYEVWNKTWEEAQGKLEGREDAIKKAISIMEKDLNVLGCSGVQDELQEGVPETLQMLNEAGIKIWVITGDKEETGIAVGRACGLLNGCELIYVNGKDKEECNKMLEEAQTKLSNEKNNKHALIITAHSIDICVEECKKIFKEVAMNIEVVMCCRSMPLQKAKIARHVRQITKKKCLAVGDGANDIPMINAASVGVGIYGKEGSQAARSADYSIYRFKHLGKLILYHGRMSLYRNTSLIKLIFFKNAAFFLHLLWFACICMFTSQRLYDDYMMALYNFIFTSIPPVFISFFDSDLSWKEIKEHPQVNRELIRTKRGNLLSYIGWFIYGTYQSMIYFYLMIIFTSNDVMTLNGKTSGMVGASAIVTTYTTLGVVATFATTVKRWNGLIIFGFFVSVGSFFFTYFFLASFSGATRENMSYFSLWRALQMPYFYLSSLLAIILAITPNILKSFLGRYVNPQNYELIQVFSKTKDDKLKKETKEQGSGYTMFHDK
ncbi:phospholipid-transporting P-type ATPase, putative [Entamoeba histolytica HM-1:IMSS-B]|uniref:Phospholipid-transporting ATPase n=5 Tax=Entamoeba histolytica TaxID=5759 RepID=C4MA58_ENTH1|nr:phospholipid-transporting P-type ATPase, putative [Entamoeba histolytica HM-1:IMSS]EMD49713.1 phospholipid-transporting P-type ATPase, putative [Entamoeba histolytica KU27]EMH73247.1 phospholipid-transporting P-type ATPase, putative [Entamoeba histolytica HM-1:IMSS-B]ENY64613.1 phospholipid-transporting P-type ATPase, putative [Entamoeba histolytica HM-1:IMSS-A]GAT98645.1 phospholipid-transporting p-type ATPase putative [Entamoeba histolytica]EAL43433.1 phospholipid-transporting P-type ATPa|eukprot:XP_648819.1 phospholipid-transporting P-type ATPase, putative [Entamoeba histolytica HM-1:IMSS]